MHEIIPQLDSEKAHEVSTILPTAENKIPNPWYFAKNALVRPVMTSLEKTTTYRLRQADISRTQLLESVITGWQKEDKLSLYNAPRLAWVQLGNSRILCSLFPYHLNDPTVGPVVVVTPSAITQKWLNNLQTHKTAESAEDPVAVAQFLSLYAGYTQPDLAQQYQKTCDNQKARTVLQAMDTFSHQDGVLSMAIATSSNQNTKLLTQLIAGSDNPSLHDVSHAHNMNAPRATKIAGAQLETGLLGGMSLESFLYAPGALNGQQLTAATGFGVLHPNTEIALLMKMNQGKFGTVQLPLDPEILTKLPGVLRSFGLAVNLDAPQIKGIFDGVAKKNEEAKKISALSIVNDALNTS